MSKKIKKRLKYYNREVFWHDTFDEICSLMMKERKYKVNVELDENAEVHYNNILSILLKIKDNPSTQKVIEVVNGNNYIESFTIRHEYNSDKDICVLMKNGFNKRTKTPYLFVTNYWLVDKNVSNKPINDSRYMKK